MHKYNNNDSSFTQKVMIFLDKNTAVQYIQNSKVVDYCFKYLLISVLLNVNVNLIGIECVSSSESLIFPYPQAHI